MKRREFIKDALAASAGAMLISGGILALGSRNANGSTQAKPTKAYQPKNYRTVTDPKNPALVAVKGKDYRAAVARAILALGGIETFIAKGDTVCIKPNIAWDRTPDQGADTNPEVVAEIVKLCLKAGAKKVIVTDVPCNTADRTYNRSGIKAAAIAEGAQIIMPEYSQFVEIDFGEDSLGKWPVLTPVLNADKLINVPIVKHHSLSGMTGAMKNWFGAVWGPRNKLHQEIDFSIAEFGRIFQPTLTIEDATMVLQKNGPQGGQSSDLIIYDTIVASIDPVAAEAYVTRFLNKKPQDFPFISMAQTKGLGSISLPENKIVAIEI